MAIMSFSNAPDLRTLGLVAGALAVDEAFVEKDWFVVQAIRILEGLKTDEIVPVFSGGTSLLKGHRLIKRFSEDIDFKLGLSESFLGLSGNKRRNALGRFKDALVAGWGEAGFAITDVVARDGNGFIRIEMDYPTLLDGHDALRPHILAELSAKPARLEPTPLPLTSFVNTYRVLPSEVNAIACVDPVETAADKLSAFAWRALTRDRTSPDDDPAIVRHLHDLAALEPAVSGHAGFPGLLMETMLADTGRGSEVSRSMPPATRLAAMMEILSVDPHYPDEYARFVEGMAFAGSDEVPTFADAVAAVARLGALLPG